MDDHERARGYRLLAACLDSPDPYALTHALLQAAFVGGGLSPFAELLPYLDDALPAEHRRLFGRVPAVSMVQSSYGRAFQLHADSTPSDHIVMQLLEAARALETDVSRDDRERWMRQRLGAWVNAFAGRLGTATRHPFYERLAPLLARWVSEDLAGADNVQAAGVA